MDKKIFNKISTFLFYISILAFIIAFNFAHNPPGGWYQQSLPSIGNRQIVDITFTDSLNGYAITTISSDTSYILKTTNGGDNWFINHTDSSFIFNRIQFINQNTGFAGGLKIVNTSFLNILKTTNAGLNWFYINAPFDTYISDMSVLNEDTIYFAMGSGFGGGVFRTTNGGTNWIRQYSAGNNPNKIYMFNSRIGFIANNKFGISTKKTTDGGFNWFTVLNEGCSDIYFADSLTGWKARGNIRKTTDGGLTWVTQILPSGGKIAISEIIKFSNINADTMWGVGAVSNLIRGLIYISTNGGTTWNYQLPDTSINIPRYYHAQFLNRLNGWAYSIYNGVHTVTGGNITSISQTGSEVPEDFKLFQNYPNPFNPVTTIEFKVKSSKDIKLTIYDITGREIAVLVNEKFNPGSYRYLFDAGSLSSGVYFYSLYADGKVVDTKKMTLVR